jgi:hypothetical protein
MNLFEKLKKHPVVKAVVIIAACVGATWGICVQVRVEPIKDIINLKNAKIAELEETVKKLEGELKTLGKKQNSSEQPTYNLEARIKEIERSLKNLTNGKDKQLEILNIYYQPPGSNEKIKISKNQTVEDYGEIWFEIKLPELGGYLLAFLRDSSERMFNLFPGTKKAVRDGYYRVPYCLNNPRTEVQEKAANNTIDKQLPLDRILIGGYKFDKTKGDEIFHFYYLDKRDKRLENIIERAIDTKKDIPLKKGILNEVSRFDPQKFDKRINRALYYRNELKLTLKHK